MTGRTHATLGAAAGLLVAGYLHSDPLYCLMLGIAGGLLPDIDHPQSILSGWIPGSSLVLSLGRVRHRGFTHSVLFCIVLLVCWFAAVQQVAIPYPFAIAILSGVVSHILSDMLTPQGIQLLYPIRGNWKAAPGIVLQAGKLFGIVEFIVWLAAVAGIGLGMFLIVTPHF